MVRRALIVKYVQRQTNYFGIKQLLINWEQRISVSEEIIVWVLSKENTRNQIEHHNKNSFEFSFTFLMHICTHLCDYEQYIFKQAFWKIEQFDSNVKWAKEEKELVRYLVFVSE